MSIIKEISDKDRALMQKTFKCHDHNCPIDFINLREVDIKYINFDGIEATGSIIIHKKIVEKIIKIFQILYENKFPIASVSPVHNYKSDEDSMLCNNSSGYFCRCITGTKQFSTHAYGLAIDINPLQNPFILNDDVTSGEIKIYPAAGSFYLNRNIILPGMVESKLKNNITIVELFKQFGFVWGGDWQNPVDYHHFQFNDI